MSIMNGNNTTPAEGTGKTNWAIGIAVAFIIGLGLGYFFWGGNEVPQNEQEEGEVLDQEQSSANDFETGTTGSEATSSAPVAQQGSSTLLVDDQSAGTSVDIRRATLSQPSWIAIREDRNGELGNILGAKLLPAGTHENFDIELLRGIIPSGVYYAVIYTDDGDRVFNYRSDSLLSDTNGVITARFTSFGKE